jgi:hypothetical protein
MLSAAVAAGGEAPRTAVLLLLRLPLADTGIGVPGPASCCRWQHSLCPVCALASTRCDARAGLDGGCANVYVARAFEFDGGQRAAATSVSTSVIAVVTRQGLTRLFQHRWERGLDREGLRDSFHDSMYKLPTQQTIDCAAQASTSSYRSACCEQRSVSIFTSWFRDCRRASERLMQTPYKKQCSPSKPQ